MSWYQEDPALSMQLIGSAASPPARVLDVGGGASLLVERLLAAGYQPGVLDISRTALALVQERLGAEAARVAWFVEDITQFAAAEPWDVWHDRAVFHFLTTPEDRAAYRRALVASTRTGAAAVVATFGPEGPTRCSGLPTMRYAPDELAAEFAPRFQLVEHAVELHRTPAGASQQFLYCRFVRL